MVERSCPRRSTRRGVYCVLVSQSGIKSPCVLVSSKNRKSVKISPSFFCVLVHRPQPSALSWGAATQADHLGSRAVESSSSSNNARIQGRCTGLRRGGQVGPHRAVRVRLLHRKVRPHDRGFLPEGDWGEALVELVVYRSCRMVIGGGHAKTWACEEGGYWGEGSWFLEVLDDKLNEMVFGSQLMSKAWLIDCEG